jgi:hypothetical protein
MSQLLYAPILNLGSGFVGFLGGGAATMMMFVQTCRQTIDSGIKRKREKESRDVCGMGRLDVIRSRRTGGGLMCGLPGWVC